jgi:hypothetical protein
MPATHRLPTLATPRSCVLDCRYLLFSKAILRGRRPSRFQESSCEFASTSQPILFDILRFRLHLESLFSILDYWKWLCANRRPYLVLERAGGFGKRIARETQDLDISEWAVAGSAPDYWVWDLLVAESSQH